MRTVQDCEVEMQALSLGLQSPSTSDSKSNPVESSSADVIPMEMNEDKTQTELGVLVSKAEKNMEEMYETREYQTYLFEKAQNENIIICLPTGCGKTFIAVKLVKDYLPRAIKLQKKIIFIAPTVPLAHQQGKYMKDHISGTFEKSASHVAIITGDMCPETWDGGKWQQILLEPHVFSMTAQILVDAVSRGHIPWKTIELLILDECHNATKEHPMAMLMREYGANKAKGGIIGETLPRILGLTATIIKGNSNINKIQDEIEEIQKLFCATATTYHDYEEVLKCSTSARVKLVEYSSVKDDELCDIVQCLEDIIVTIEGMSFFLLETSSIVDELDEETLVDDSQLCTTTDLPLDPLVNHVEEVLEVLNELGPFCAKNAAMLKIAFLSRQLSIEMLKSRRKRNLALVLVIKSMITRFDEFIVLIDDYMVSHSDVMTGDRNFVREFITPKLQALVNTLSSERPSKGKEEEPLCGLVFCQQRIITQMVMFYLQDLSTLCADLFGFIKCSYVMGTAGNRDMVSMKASLAKQTEVLNDFRHKKLNLLIATNVLEEGLNVPSCNFIVRFDPILSYPSYVQSMGRARQKGARFYALVDLVNHAKVKSAIEGFADFNLKLSDALTKKAEHPEQFFQDDNFEYEESELNALIPPFIPGDGTSKINAGSAVSIVYRYCQSLACDKLCTLIPRAWIVTVNGKFVVHVKLPLGSVVKKVEGPAFTTKSLAKKAAFLEVCKKLYEAGVLHPKTLLPIPRNIPVFANEFLAVMEGIDDVDSTIKGKKIGSKSRMAWYPKQLPKVFENSQPDSGQNWRIYGIIIRLTTYFGSEDVQGLLQFEKLQHLYGIVTCANLSEVPEFLLLSRDGNFKICLEEVKVNGSSTKDLNLTREQIENLKEFQECIFSDLLNIKHAVLKKADSPYYVAPLLTPTPGDLTDVQIQWDLITKLIEGRIVDYGKEVSIADRRQMTFESEKYIGALVVPWYTSAHHDKPMYSVVSVQQNENPLSSFEDPTKYSTFVDYYDSKKIHIVHKEGQPLLKSKPISKQLNYLSPKYKSWTMSQSERQDARYSIKVVTMIPELIRVHPLPADLFIQAKMLPSCLHRIHRLLLAEEIRDSVAQHVGWRVNDASSKLENYNMLMQMETNISVEVRPLLNDAIDSKPQKGIQMMVSTPSVSGNYTAPAGNIQDPNRAFAPKRKLLWCELEYVHPKLMKKEDIIFECDDEDEMDVDSDIESPSSPTAAEISGIHLISSDEVPCQNFDAVTDFEVEKGPSSHTIMEALTLANGRDNFSLEKLEMIGDSVLKLIVTSHLYTHFPKWNEGNMTALKCRLISNRHLFTAVKNKNLGSRLAGSLFEPETSWLPPGVNISQNVIEVAVSNATNYAPFSPIIGTDETVELDSLSSEELSIWLAGRINHTTFQAKGPPHTSYTHSRLGDKSIADSVESLIGAYYNFGGIDSAIRLMDWIGLKGPTEDKTARKPYMCFRDLPAVIPEHPTVNEAEAYIPFLSEIEDVLDYRFKNRWYLVEAFTHPSYVGNTVTNGYQRLEFLGDAVLDFVITHFIYKTKRADSPGSLTDLRSALVNNITFGSLAVRYGFHKKLQYFSNALQDAIDLFSAFQQKNNHKVTGHCKLIMEADCVIAEDIEVPKALGDVFESLAGAVFLDSGMSLDTVWRVFYRLMQPEIDEFSGNIPITPVRKIYEMFPGKALFKSLENERMEEEGYKVVQLNIPGYQSFLGSGVKKENAKQAAAKFALQMIIKDKAV